MNINYGLLPEIEAPARAADGARLGKRDRGRVKKRAIAERAFADLSAWARPPALVA